MNSKSINHHLYEALEIFSSSQFHSSVYPFLGSKYLLSHYFPLGVSVSLSLHAFSLLSAWCPQFICWLHSLGILLFYYPWALSLKKAANLGSSVFPTAITSLFFAMKRPNKIGWKYWKSSTLLPSINLFGSCVSVHKAAAFLYQLNTLKSTAYWYDSAFKNTGMKTDTLGKTNNSFQTHS